MIAFADFAKLEIRIGRVLSAEKVENADKLLRLEVDFWVIKQDGDSTRVVKQILSGIAEFYKPEDLLGKEFPFIVNLEPRVIRGLESQGMILAVDTGESVVLLNPDKEVKEGSKVR